MIKKILMVFPILITLILIIGCETQTVNDQKIKAYQMEHVYLAKSLNMQDKPYSITLDFIAQDSSDRLSLFLDYSNITEDKQILQDIHKSLIGFSIKVIEDNTNSMIYSYEIIEAQKLSFSYDLPHTSVMINLGPNIAITKNKKYKVIINIPEEKNQYHTPTLVMGIIPKPWL